MILHSRHSIDLCGHCSYLLCSLLLCVFLYPSHSITSAVSTAEPAPPEFDALFVTNKGPFVIHVNREWAPIGADRFFHLLSKGYYSNNKFFKVVKDFGVQFGINPEENQNRIWANADLDDDPQNKKMKRGWVVCTPLI